SLDPGLIRPPVASRKNLDETDSLPHERNLDEIPSSNDPLSGQFLRRQMEVKGRLRQQIIEVAKPPLICCLGRLAKPLTSIWLSREWAARGHCVTQRTVTQLAGSSACCELLSITFAEAT